MLTLSHRNQLVIGAVLALLLATTRGEHFATLHSLPEASWAVFFLAGVYLRQRWVFPALLAVAAFLDYAAVTWGGVSNFCISPAYGFLLPAYGALWLAGRWYAARHSDDWRTLLPLVAAVLAGATVCELFSSGGFYFFSGRFADTSFAEFGTRLVTYFPPSLQSVAFYVGVAAAVHVLFALAGSRARKPSPVRGL